MENINCIICKSKNKIKLSDTGQFGLPTSAVMCSSCGFVYNSPRLDKDEYNAFNSYLYRIMYGFYEPEKDYIRNQKRRAGQIWNYLVENDIDLQQMDSVLDVGSSAGGTLAFFKSKGLKDAYGIEPHKQFSDYARNKLKLNVHTGTLEDWISDKKFDLIIMRDVLEHFLRPDKALKIIKKHCHKNSVIFIETNNVFKTLYLTKPYKHVFQWAHPFTFSVNSLENLLNLCGFNMTAVKDERYLKCIARKYSNLNSMKQNFKIDKTEDVLKYINNHNRLLKIKNFYRKIRGLI